MNRNADLEARFPNASRTFLALNSRPADPYLAPPVCDPQPEPAPREEPLDTHQTQKRGQGRTLVLITRCGVRLLDADNLCGGTKPLVDALRYARYIPDDDPGSIQLIVTQRKVPKGQTGTQVLIIPSP